MPYSSRNLVKETLCERHMGGVPGGRNSRLAELHTPRHIKDGVSLCTSESTSVVMIPRWTFPPLMPNTPVFLLQHNGNGLYS